MQTTHCIIPCSSEIVGTADVDATIALQGRLSTSSAARRVGSRKS